MFSCPHCGKPGISVRQRCFRRNRWEWEPLVCRLCQGKAKEEIFNSLLFLLPFILVVIGVPIFARELLEDPVWGVPLGLLVPVTFFSYVFCYFKWAPLTRV